MILILRPLLWMAKKKQCVAIAVAVVLLSVSVDMFVRFLIVIVMLKKEKKKNDFLVTINYPPYVDIGKFALVATETLHKFT